MHYLFLLPIALFMLFSCSNSDRSDPSDLYKFDIETIDGNTSSMAEYKGKVILIVNTASKCGFTGQYEGLQKLYDKYKDQGFVILGFPSNQFANQEPGTNEDIAEFCSVNYGVTFPMFAKIDVNGDKAHPLFNHLKKNAPGLLTGDIKWNFTKFLIDREGNIVERFSPMTTPEKIDKDIVELLKETK